VDYKTRNIRALQLSADSKIEAKSTEAYKSAFLLEVYLHGENVAARQQQHEERPYPILLALNKVCLVSARPIIVFLENKDRPAWFRQTPAQVRALQPTPRETIEKCNLPYRHRMRNAV
jgi:hypothetical protein